MQGLCASFNNMWHDNKTVGTSRVNAVNRKNELDSLGHYMCSEELVTVMQRHHPEFRTYSNFVEQNKRLHNFFLEIFPKGSWPLREGNEFGVPLSWYKPSVKKLMELRQKTSTSGVVGIHNH